MAKVSLNQAAKDTGVSLPTLSRWRKKGRISAEKTDGGGYLIDTSEYDRIREMQQQSPHMKHYEHSKVLEIATQNETKVLQVEIQFLREQVDGLKIERDDWKKQAQTLLLQAPPSSKKSAYLPLALTATLVLCGILAAALAALSRLA